MTKAKFTGSDNVEKLDLGDVSTNLDHIADKLSLIADVNFADISTGGAEGIVFLLRDLGKEIRACSKLVWEIGR